MRCVGTALKRVRKAKAMGQTGENRMDLSRAQMEIQKAARAFARGEFDKDLALEKEAAGAFPERVWQKAGELGFLGLHFPEKYGGGGLGLLEAALVAETFCRQDSSIGSALTLSGFGAECLLRFGNEGLKSRFLPAVTEARVRCGMAVSEPGTKENGSAMQTHAAPAQGRWIITGRKSYVLNGEREAFYIVTCRTGPEEISMILIEAGQPGVVLKDLGRSVGLNMTGAAQLELSEVEVPEDYLVGTLGQGAAQFHRFMDDALVLLGAAAVGIAAGAFDRTLAYIKEREAFNRKLAAFEVTRDKIAIMVAKIQTARAIVYAAARRQDSGNAGTLPAVAKMTACRAAVEVADEAIQLFGGYGYMKETEVERFYRDAKMIDLLFGGPSSARKRIADAVIGKNK
jgi:alkylation response protein AidB-like acyl-CoA dehydrogenase